ncbi:MAG: IS66 family transposase [Dehalococcoidia bacterium]
MLQVDHIDDVAQLRQIAHLLERENDRLHTRLRELVDELNEARGEDTGRLQRELALLTELIQKREETARSPKEDSGNGTSSKREKKHKKPQRGHGPRPQPQLPLVEETYELAEFNQGCSVCGGRLSEMKGQFEEAEEISVVRREFVLVQQKRQKYRCRCNANIVTTPGPPKLRPGCRYSIDFAVEVAASKYLDHTPLERQVRIMEREGLSIDSQTLWDQLSTLAFHLAPSYEAVRGRVLSSPLVHADETSWRLLEKKGSKKWWVWSVASDDAVYYRIRSSRATESAEDLLEGYSGIVMADGYGVYESLSRASPDLKLVNCWAHARRKFEEIADNYPRQSVEMLALIKELYAVEHDLPVWDRSAPLSEQESVLEGRRLVRQERSREILDRIRDWVYAERPLPASELGKAIAYMGNRWQGLTAFLDDGRVPLDNNHAERAMRGVVLGRKNHYGSKSRRGTEVAAIFYTLLETAKLAGVEPKAYLADATRNAIEHPGCISLPRNS